MTVPSPQHTSREKLADLMHHELASLEASQLTWWQAHNVSPFPAVYREAAHFVVAVDERAAVFFADDEDEFGIAKLDASGHFIMDYGLVGDLKEAITLIQANAT